MILDFGLCSKSLVIESMKQPQNGMLLCRRYEVVREVGQGGMATVYEAYDRIRQESVALKLINPQLRLIPEIERRFMDEATLTSRLNHPRIINVHDIEHSECGVLISMELLRGRTLRKVIEEHRRSGRLVPLEEAISLVRQIGEALTYAHLFTIHRDLKPENVWVDLEGQVKLMDFGLAKVHTQGVAARTEAGASMGTPYYIAPEQLSDEYDVRPTADQYSLAAIAYELLTGEVPAGVPRPVHAVRSEVPRHLSHVIARGLAREPLLRFKDVEGFMDAFSEQNPLFRKYLSSPRQLAIAAMFIFSLGAVAVAFFEQAAVLIANRANDSAYWERTVRANQALLSEEWQEVYLLGQRIGERLDWLRSSPENSGGLEIMSERWQLAINSILEGQIEGDSGGIEQLEIETKLIAMERVERARIHAERSFAIWQPNVEPEAPALLPDLKHVAELEHWKAQALEASHEERFEDAAQSYLRIAKQNSEWNAELESLKKRTFRSIQSLDVPPVLYTNILGMVFVKLPEVKGVPEEYWVS